MSIFTRAIAAFASSVILAVFINVAFAGGGMAAFVFFILFLCFSSWELVHP
ncbi:hypothetical protein [Halobacillus sp. A5]|uniref:hypothetical protein n=1 Tax=Halobacillus sp. A5 TaxID=2880263 RepID=UPI0020A64A56|nr:hypothetical protein [Halobacillus sp. A5]MCP3026468.1 hypothetical protein [Halobacillus sp. A5]